MVRPHRSDHRSNKEDQENNHGYFVTRGFKNEPDRKPDEHGNRESPHNDLGTLSMSASWSFFEHDPEMGFGVGDFQRRPTLSLLLPRSSHNLQPKPFNAARGQLSRNLLVIG